MKILSLFNGISCGRVALERAGIPVERYVSYEIDKYANKVSQANYPNDEYNGDVFEADFTQYKDFDILIGGSPCTHWSIAKQGRETTSSGIGWELFMQYKRALVESQCKWFLYENNYSIHKDIKEAITHELDVEPIMINSALVSAQQRKRLYWTNIPSIEQPRDKGILLRDILESGIVDKEKSYCITSTEYKGGNLKSYCEKHRRQQIFEPVGAALRSRKNGIQLEVNNIQKSIALTQNTDHHLICEPIRLGHISKDKDYQSGRVYSIHGKSVNLCGASGGGGVKTGLYKLDLPDGDYVVRKLTPVECERLQTLPDNYTAGISNTQRYKCLGNGWTVDVISHILRGLK